MSSEERVAITIESLLKSGAIIGHKDGNYGSYYPRVEEFGTEGVPFLTAKSLNNGRIDIHGAPCLSEQRASELRFGFVQPGDVLLSHNATVGRVAVVPEFNGRLLVGTSLTYFRVDTTRISPRYLAAYFSSLDFQNQLAGVMSHSTRNQVPVSAQRALQIILPSLAEQVAIAEVLSVFDNKIEMIRLMNETLEKMARATFKSWFVDFDPVRAKVEGREPEGIDAQTAVFFPDHLDESEIGQIPASWSVVRMGAIAKPTIGGVWGYDSKESPNLVQAVCLRGVDLEHLRASGSAIAAPKRWVKPAAMEQRRLDDDEILIGGSGAGPVGRPLQAHRDFERQYGMPVVYSNFVKRFKCADEAHAIYLDRVLAEMHRSGEIKDFVNGTSVPNLDDKSLLSTKRVSLPPPEILHSFAEIIKPFLAKRYDPAAAILADLRDTILPRLLSGKLRVSDTEKILERCYEHP